MKIFSVIGTVLFLASQFLCQAYAIELCESQDYYNLVDSTKCKIKYNKANDKSDPRELMFEIMKNYPYEEKDRFAQLFQKKIGVIDNYIKQQQHQKQTEKTKVNISKLEQTKQGLSVQLGVINSATRDNWVSVRDRASKELKEATRRLQEVD